MTATVKESSKYTFNDKLPIHKYTPMNRTLRLKSKKQTRNLIENQFYGKNDWRPNWSLSNADRHQLIKDPYSHAPGFSLKRQEWFILYKIRNKHGKCEEMLFKWVMKDSPSYDCGQSSQTMEHIKKYYPIRAFNKPTNEIHSVTNAALTWLRSLDILL